MLLDFLSKFIQGLPDLFVWLGLASVGTVEGESSVVYNNAGALALYLICLISCVAILPYLLGSVSVPRFYCKKVVGIDVYKLGTQRGELGDVWKYVGKKHAIACWALEILKIMLCMAFGFFAMGEDGADGAAIAAFFCLLGDVLPIWHKMRGTRGFETAAICTLILDPLTFAILLVIYLIVLIGMRYSTTARVFPTLLYPLIASAFLMNPNPTAVLMSVGMVAVLMFSHWKNIQAMFNREEPRLEFKKKKQTEEEE